MKKEIERKLAFAVKVSVLKVDTLENIIYGKEPSKLHQRLTYLAKKNNCIGFDVQKNSFIFLFLVYNDAKVFYTYANKDVKCTLLKRQIKVVAERNTPIVKA